MFWFSRKLAVFAMASLLSMTGKGLPAATAEEALNGCKGFPDVDRPNTCRAYFVTVLDFIGSDDEMSNPKGALCVKEETPIAEVISMVMAWIESHPEQKNISLYDATHNALSPNFPCE